MLCAWQPALYAPDKIPYLLSSAHLEQVENAESSGNRSKAAEAKARRHAELIEKLHAQQKALKRSPGRKVRCGCLLTVVLHLRLSV